MSDGDSVRLDKWLWAARFYKTRSLATAAVAGGDVRVSGERVKPARVIRPGDRVQVQRGEHVIDATVCGVSDMRGPAAVAQQLYEETAESREQRARQAERRKLAREPALDIKGRPTKRDARALRRLRGSA